MPKNIHPTYQEAHRRRLNLTDATYAICWISIAIVIALFFADHGAAELQTPAGFWTGMGQYTGLVGTDLLLIQLMLAARLPWVDQSLGHDRAIEIHQKLGKPVLILITLHAITLTIGYGLSDKLSFIPEYLSMFHTIPDMLSALVGLVLLFAIVGTSLVIVRRKLDYDHWFIIHLIAYVAVVAAIPHQFSADQIFGEGTISRYYWMALYVTVGGCLFTFRVLHPIVASIRHATIVTDIKKESKDVITLTITGRDIHKLEAAAGQFFMWRFLEPGLWWHTHPFSLSASPANNTLRITIRALGHGSEKIQNIKVGTRVTFQGPYGIFTERARTSEDITLVAAGIGITPIRALLEEAEFRPGHATVVIRKTNDSDYLLDEMKAIAARRGAKLIVLSGPRSKDPTKWIPDSVPRRGSGLKTLVPNVENSDIYVCGPASWSKLVVEDAKRAGLHRHQIHWERFNW